MLEEGRISFIIARHIHIRVAGEAPLWVNYPDCAY
jgi:hypothetical protein